MLDQVLQEAGVLACKCLSQPWDSTEVELRQNLMRWHELLNHFAQQQTLIQSQRIQPHILDLNDAIQQLIQSLHSRDSILLSHTLCDRWIPVIEALMSS